MPVFSYRGATREGVIVEGAIEAADERAAVERLKTTGVIPLRVATPAAASRWSLRLKSSRADLVSFTTELSALLGASLPRGDGNSQRGAPSVQPSVRPFSPEGLRGSLRAGRWSLGVV